MNAYTLTSTIRKIVEPEGFVQCDRLLFNRRTEDEVVWIVQVRDSRKFAKGCFYAKAAHRMGLRTR